MYIRYLDPEHSELWVADLDASNRLKLASGAHLQTRDWGTDGSQVSFADGTRLYVAGANGRGLHEIKGIEGAAGCGAWSVDNTRLFITTTKDAIWTANVDGSHVEKLLDRGFLATAVSPDGKYVLGSIDSGTEVGIYQMAVADKRRVPLLPGTENYMLRFTPDYKSFVYAVPGRGEITFFARDGEMARSLECRRLRSNYRSPSPSPTKGTLSTFPAICQRSSTFCGDRLRLHRARSLPR